MGFICFAVGWRVALKRFYFIIENCRQLLYETFPIIVSSFQ